MKNNKDLNVWRKAHELVLTIYRITKSFPKEEQFNLISQLRRAGTSIPTNIAEGGGKYTQRDFAKFLQDAQGSSHEVEYLSFLSYELGYLKDGDFKALDSNINEVKAMLIGLLNKIRKDANLV
jgi:four helix bundle protein